MTVASSGVYGEVLGGHYGPAMLALGLQKIPHVLRSMLNRARANQSLSQVSLQQIVSFIGSQWNCRPWFVAENFWREHVGEGFAHSLTEALDRLQARGIATLEQLLEAFVTEHRGAQYIAAQPLSLRTEVDVSLPFATPKFLEFAARLPFAAKVHNRFNKELLASIAPALLELPLSATYFPARAPLLLQEVGRLARRGAEELQWGLCRASDGLIAPPRNSWINYRFLGENSELSDLVEDLKLDYWDHQALKLRVRELRSWGGQRIAHSIAEVLLKIYNVELMGR
jgi:hypothetical protein